MHFFLFIPNLLLTLGLTGMGMLPVVQLRDAATQPNISFSLIRPIVTVTPTPTAKPTPSPKPTPTPTPRPLTFEEMNEKYGPCVHLPVLFWHHIQSLPIAKQENHARLTVDTAIFRSQMQYLKDHGYTTIRPEQLTAFFDSGTPLPAKSVLLTVDDGYDDFASDAAPIIKEFGFQITAFIPTGLLNNPGYMTWDTLTGLSGSGNFYFANHTWSHRNVNASESIDEREISTADMQLSQHGFNQGKIFAYPYGFPNKNAISVLESLGYKLAFTTYPGSTQCRENRYILQRMRVGNAGLSAYGL